MPKSSRADATRGKPEPLIFSSEEYIAYRLEEGESPPVLAERFLGNKSRSWIIEEANRGISFEKDDMVIIPLKEENRGGLSTDGYQVVPVLCYHHLAEDCRSSLCTPVSLFERQMRYLKENGYRVIAMSELLEFLNYQRELPEKAVVITIDDGYRSAYDRAYPMLKKYGFVATFFIYTDFVGRSDIAITWDQLKAMKADGFEIGSHTLTHCDLTKKEEGEDVETYLAEVRRQLLLSKQIIDKKLDQNTVYLAFPYGEYDHRILNLCEQLGYEIGFSVKKGSNPFFSDPLTLRRNQILKKDMESFVTKLKTFHDFPLR
ncbi:MAG: polysaccharide deacetylase family protein [Desulfobacteraceae bacterium]